VRLKPDPAQRELLLRLGVVVACTMGVALLPFALSPAVLERFGSGDFQWSGAHLLVEGRSAYFAALHEGGKGLLWNQNPNYLHLLYLAMAPLGALSFAKARLVWAVLNLVMALCTALLLARGARLGRWQRAGVIGLFMSSGPFIFALGVGQQTFLVMLCSTLAFMVHGRAPARGFSLALAMTKYSFAPLAVGVMLRGQRAVVGWSIAVSVTAWLVFAGLTRTSLIESALGPLAVGRTMARGNADVMTLTGMAVGAPRTPLVYAVGIVVGAALVWFARDVLRRGPWYDALSAAFLISLVTFPHLLYDNSVLLAVLVSGLKMSRLRRWFVVTVVSVFWFPWLIGGSPLPAYRPPGVFVSFLLLLGALAVLVRKDDRGLPPPVVVADRFRQEVSG
jgi:glycosyl transferase family 87